MLVNGRALWNPFRGECEIVAGEASEMTTLTTHEKLELTEELEEEVTKSIERRKLGTVDDKMVRKESRKVARWAKETFTERKRASVRDGSRRRRCSDSPPLKKKQKRTLEKSFVAVIVNNAKIAISSVGDAQNGAYVRPVLTLVSGVEVRFNKKRILAKWLTFSSANKQNESIVALIDDGENEEEKNCVEVTLAAMPKREAQYIIESEYKIGRCIELIDFAIAETNREDGTIKKLYFMDKMSSTRFLYPKRDASNAPCRFIRR